MARLSAPRGICLLKGMDSAIVNMKPTDEVEVRIDLFACIRRMGDTSLRSDP